MQSLNLQSDPTADHGAASTLSRAQARHGLSVVQSATEEGEDEDTGRVLVTILFVDIVASTEKIAAIGDRAWAKLLIAFRATVRDALAACFGREIATTGDGFLATFDGPSRGIRCAGQIHAKAARLGLAVRAGLHAGEVEWEEDEVVGIAVHIGARITALAAANETLVSGMVRDLVVGGAERFDARGTHVLRGVPGQWSLYAVANSAQRDGRVDHRSNLTHTVEGQRSA